MKKNKIFQIMLPILVAIMFTSFIKCSNRTDTYPLYPVCGVENALTDLEWLYTLIETYSSTNYPMLAKVYKCKYADNQEGFLLNPCYGCPDAGTILCSCDGNTLCTSGTLNQQETCDEYQIDENSIELIYSNNKSSHYETNIFTF